MKKFRLELVHLLVRDTHRRVRKWPFRSASIEGPCCLERVAKIVIGVGVNTVRKIQFAQPHLDVTPVRFGYTRAMSCFYPVCTYVHCNSLQFILYCMHCKHKSCFASQLEQNGICKAIYKLVKKQQQKKQEKVNNRQVQGKKSSTEFHESAEVISHAREL